MLPEKPPSAARLKDLSPEKVDLLWPKELALAYKEAKALPNCAVICDDTALSRTHKRGLLEKLKKRADAEKRLKEPKE